MKPKIIIMTKRKIMIYAIILLVVVIGIALLISLGKNNTDNAPSSGYTYLEYKDGVYEATEKTEQGNIKVEVAIKKSKIKEIKVVEFPEKYIADNPLLKEQIKGLTTSIIKTQDAAINIDNTQATAFLLTKLSKAIITALDQSILTQ